MGWREGTLREGDFHHAHTHKPRAAAISPCGNTTHLMSGSAGDLQSHLGGDQCHLQQGCDRFVTCNFHIAAEEAETHRGATKVHFKLIYPHREEEI